MSGGGSSSSQQPQQINQTTTSLPEYAQPYYTNLMDRAQAESYRPYTLYEGERVADFTPDQTTTQQNIMGMQTPEQFGMGTDLINQAAASTAGAANYAPGTFNAQTVTNPNLTTFQMGAPQTFGQAQAQQYMSPYSQDVTEIAKREAIKDAQRTQLMTNLGAARQGTYGGSRQLLAGLDREQALGQELGDIQVRGLQAAYENAQQQFERDRVAKMAAEDANLRAKLGVQELGSGQTMQAKLANQQYNLEAQRLSELSRQFGSTNQLQAYNQMGQYGQTLANLGTAQQQAQAQTLGMQQAVGQSQQALDQQYLDTAYGDFLRQRDYPMEQLSYLSEIMHGQPVQLNSTSTSYAPPPSASGQLLGAGLGAAGLYNMVG